MSDISDGVLTERGRLQAKRVAERLKHEGIEVILSSPLIRALETAQPLARELGLPIHVVSRAYEVRDNVGVRARPVHELEQRIPEAIFEDSFDRSPEGWPYEGKQTRDSVHNRVQEVLELIFQGYPKQRVALFAHATFNCYLLYAAMGLKYGDPRLRVRQENGCVNRLSFPNGPDSWYLHYMNDHGHVADT